MSNNPKRILIYGGAFSPPHTGHAAAIEKAIRLFPTDEFWIMPSADRQDKNMSLSAEDRIAMISLMIEDAFGETITPIKISTIEIERGIPTTTYETLQELKKRFPENIFYFLMGTENLPQIATHWINGKELLEEARIVAITRPGTRHAVDTSSVKPLEIHLLAQEEGMMEVSSTFLRNLAAEGRSLLPYVSPKVAAYIKKRRLFS